MIAAPMSKKFILRYAAGARSAPAASRVKSSDAVKVLDDSMTPARGCCPSKAQSSGWRPSPVDVRPGGEHGAHDEAARPAAAGAIVARGVTPRATLEKFSRIRARSHGSSGWQTKSR